MFVNPLDVAFYTEIRRDLLAEEPTAVLAVVKGPESLVGREVMLDAGGQLIGTLDGNLDEAAREIMWLALDSGKSRRVILSAESGVEIEAYVDVIMPQPTLIIVGGTHISLALVTFAQALGFRTVVIDPRKTFGSAERFSHANLLVQLWPDKALAQVVITRSTAVAVLTHDPKIDDPALIKALPSPAFYVGALGSKTTHAKRRERLLHGGLSQADLDRLHGPIGLEIGAKKPEEIALAIMAEIIAERGRALTAASTQMEKSQA